MLDCFKHHWMFCTLLLLLAVGSIPAGLNYSGFCWEQKRWLSDEEFLLAMLGHTEGDRIRNEERKTFLKEHPDCCYFSRGDIPPRGDIFITFLNRIMGTYASGEVHYKLTDEERRRDGETGNDYYLQSIVLDTCGNADNEFSWTLTEEEHRQNYDRYLRNKTNNR